MAAPHAVDAQAPAAPTYSRDVAPILYRNCTSCHRPGEIAPMSLLTYQDARPWAQVHRHARDGRHDAAVARGSVDGRVPQRPPPDAPRKRTPSRSGWPPARRKAIRGDLPAPPRYAEGWTIGQPDAVLTMQEDYPIPASGTVAYQYFEVPTNFTEDKWVQAFEVRPGNRAASCIT